MSRPPLRSPRTDTLLPYTALFRSSRYRSAVSGVRNPAYAAPASGGTAWISSPVTGGAMTTLRRHLRGNQPLQFFLHKLDGWRFQSDRADYSDYLSFLLQGIQGIRTFKDLFHLDGRLYGQTSVRVLLSSLLFP